MSKIQWAFFGLIELLLVTILVVFNNFEIYLLFVIVQIHYLLVRKAYLIRDNWFNGADWFRRTTYFIPYVLPFTFSSHKIGGGTSFSFLFILGAIVTGVSFLALRYRDLQNMYNRELMAFFPKVSLREASLEMYSSVGSALLQELFYKAFVISVLAPLIGAIPAVLLSAFLFVAEHIVHFWAANLFEWKDYIAQFILSAVAGFLYVYSGSIVVAMLTHLTYNLPTSFNYVYRYCINQFAERKQNI